MARGKAGLNEFGAAWEGGNCWRTEALKVISRPELVSRSECYPVHFQQNARFSLRIAEAGVGEAGAETQEAPLEATSFLCHAISVILHKIFSLRAFLVILLLCIIISWETKVGTGWDKWNKISFNMKSSHHRVEVLLLCKKVSRCST